MKSFNCLFINSMARSKINKRSKPHDPKKARCERRLCFNLKSVDGRILSPKKALEFLRERRDDVFVLLLNKFDEDLVQENIVLREEMSICEAFLDKNKESVKGVCAPVFV